MADSAVQLPPVAPRAHRFRLLAALYASQAIPLGFFIEAVPAIGRDLGLSLTDIGRIQALALPFMIKFLWAPLVDGIGSRRIGHYRSWLLPVQSLAVLAVAGLSLLDPSSDIGLILAVGGIFMLLAATQDIATDGLAVHLLDFFERGRGNAVQVGGYYLGQIVGGGLMLVLFGQFGWRVALLAMAAFLSLPLIPLLGFREPTTDVNERPRVDFRALARFFRRPGTAGWVSLLLLYRAADAAAMTMLKPLLVDRDWSLAEIGLLLGVGNSAAALTGAVIGGTLVERLGRRRCLVLFAVLQSAALAALFLIDVGSAGAFAVWPLSMLAACAGGMATTALYTRMMDGSARRSAGTDFTIQQSLAVIGPLTAAAFSGASAQALGYGPHFLACGGLALASAGVAAFALREETPPSAAAGTVPADSNARR